MAVKKNELVVSELRKQFLNMDASFLNPIRSYDDKVNNDVINFTEIGAAPNVLIDNAVYPIATNSRTDDNRPVSLRKLETENTKITDDELHALGYDKNSSVMEQHKTSLMRSYLKLGAWSLAPSASAAATPVLKTTGATVGHRKRLTPDDLVAYKVLCDNLEIDLAMRYFALSAEHAGDLLLVDQSFRDRYNNTATGEILRNIYGFNMFETVHTPKYLGTNDTKKAFGAAALSTDVSASVFYTSLNSMKAIGSISMYYSEASADPENRMSKVGFRMYGIVSPVVASGVGAIIDTYV